MRLNRLQTVSRWLRSAGRAPTLSIWAHDKVGEWADAGLIAPVEVSNEFLGKFLPKAWEAVIHKGWVWGYPVALETVALIYNKKLLEGPPPTTLSDMASVNEEIKKKHLGLTPILGVDGNVGRPSVGVMVAYHNRSSQNQDLATEFRERYALTEEGLTAIDHAKRIGVPALISLYEKMAKDDPLLRQLKVCVDNGQIMPNIPQMGRFFSSVGAALQTATEGQTSPQAALREAEANIQHQSATAYSL